MLSKTLHLQFWDFYGFVSDEGKEENKGREKVKLRDVKKKNYENEEWRKERSE